MVVGLEACVTNESMGTGWPEACGRTCWSAAQPPNTERKPTPNVQEVLSDRAEGLHMTRLMCRQWSLGDTGDLTKQPYPCGALAEWIKIIYKQCKTRELVIVFASRNRLVRRNAWVHKSERKTEDKKHGDGEGVRGMCLRWRWRSAWNWCRVTFRYMDESSWWDIWIKALALQVDPALVQRGTQNPHWSTGWSVLDLLGRGDEQPELRLKALRKIG